MMENKTILKKTFFNSTKDSLNILFLFNYIDNKDLFVRKLLTELIVNFDKTKNGVSFYLNLKKAHLNNRKTKHDFIDLNKVVYDTLNLRDEQKLFLTDELIINTDNASESLVVFYELNELSTTITFISKVVDPLSQLTIHTRNSMHSTHYLPINSKIYGTARDDYNRTLYSLITKKYIEEEIAKNLNTVFDVPTVIARAFIPVVNYNRQLNNIHDTVKAESLESLNKMTGFSIRENIEPDFTTDFVYVMKDKDGFYLSLNK